MVTGICRECRSTRDAEQLIADALSWVMAAMGPTRRRHSERWAGNLLRMARAKRGWSQRTLAQVAGVPQSTIGRIESGAMQPTLPLLDRILVAADFDLRTRLEPYDDHDDVLDSLDAALSGNERDRGFR